MYQELKDDDPTNQELIKEMTEEAQEELDAIDLEAENDYEIDYQDRININTMYREDL